MHKSIKLMVAGVLGCIPALALAHTEHAHGNSLFLTLLHPFTGIDHLIGLFLLGLLLYMARHHHIYPHWLGALCMLFLPLLFSYSYSTTMILAMDTICLGLLAWLRLMPSDLLGLES